MSRSFEVGARVGPGERFELTAAYHDPGVWRVRDALSGRACRLRALPLPMPERVEAELREREKLRILKELERWSEVGLARPRTVELFWEGDALCWVEEQVKGAPLSSLDGRLPLIDGLSLIEEVLFALDDHQSYTDFMTGEPLLHLNLHPSTILRGAEGELYLMDPLCPTWVQLRAQHTKQRLEELDGAHAPELTRGRSEPSSDLYALGMSTLAAMSGMSLKRVDQRLNSGRLLSQDLTLAPSVARFFGRLVSFRASERFESPAEALSALRSLPRELYEPLGSLLEQRAHPPTALSEPQRLPLERVASVRVSDELSDALGAFELSDEELDGEPLTLNRRSSGERPLEPARPAPHAEDSLDEEGEVGRLLLIEHKGEQASQQELSQGLSFYTRAHEPRLPPSEGGARSTYQADGVTEVEVVEEGGRGGLLWLTLLLLLVLAGLSLRAQGAGDTPQPQDKGAAPVEVRATSGVDTREIDTHGGNPLEARGTPARQGATGSQGAQPQLTASLNETELARRSKLPVWRSFAEGEVWVGALEGEGYADEHPRRRVKVEPFELSLTEVTVLQYARCVEGGACDVERVRTPDWGDAQQCNWERADRLDHPMNCVSWRQALDYARWVGGRLPSEAEWSYAAQGGGDAPTDGLRYPWGQKSRGCGHAILHHRSRGDGCGAGGTAPVCSAPKGSSAQGLCDLVGNVWEWMTDEYHPSYQGAPVDGSAWALLPLDRWSLIERSLRGAAFDERDLPRVARRNHYGGGAHLATVGFRVARDVSRPPPPALIEPLTPAGGAAENESGLGERLLKPATD